MKLLLDTHIWIWSVLHPNRLGRRARRELANPRNELHLSPVSIWETHHLVQRGRLRLDKATPEWVEQTFRQSPLREAPLNFAVAAAAAGIELPQSDIGDVFLAATAFIHDLTLVTVDPQLLACSWLKTMAGD
jgi:PIN domain nuclease of toxin-antitoxin system